MGTLQRVQLFCMTVCFLISVHLPRGQSKEKFLIAKSWGKPMNLQCKETVSTRITVSGITLFKNNVPIPAKDKFPSIGRDSQMECERTLKFADDNTRHTACTLEFKDFDITSDIEVVTLFTCSHGSGSDNQIHQVSSLTGDVNLQCTSSDIISILEITFDGEPPEDLYDLKRTCIEEMIAGKLPKPEDASTKVYPAKCTIRRNGKKGKLVVKYKCLIPPENETLSLSKRKNPASLDGATSQKREVGDCR